MNKDLYNKLSKYYNDFHHKNLSNMIILECIFEEDNNRFQYIFIYYIISIIEFKYYLFIPNFNETHLKMKYKSIFLIIVNININDSLFLLIFIIINVENDNNWF